MQVQVQGVDLADHSEAGVEELELVVHCRCHRQGVGQGEGSQSLDRSLRLRR